MATLSLVCRSRSASSPTPATLPCAASGLIPRNESILPLYHLWACSMDHQDQIAVLHWRRYRKQRAGAWFRLVYFSTACVQKCGECSLGIQTPAITPILKLPPSRKPCSDARSLQHSLMVKPARVCIRVCVHLLSVLRNTTLDTHSGSWKAPRTLLLQYPMYHPQLVNVDEPNTTSTAVSCLTHPREAVVMRSVVHAEHGVEHGRRGCHSRQELPISEGLRL